jgi:hypothetical protein
MSAELQPLAPPRRSVPAGSLATLWSRSRSWRALVVSSCVLTSLAISAPMVLPQSTSCTLQIPTEPQRVSGRVTGFLPQDGAEAGTRAVEARLGAKVSPGYLALRRVNVAYPGQSTPFTFAAIPDNVVVKVGDMVELHSRYRDPNLPCNFIPWMVSRVLGGSG